MLVKGEEFYREQDCEEILSARSAKKRDMRVCKNAIPVMQRRGQYCTYDLFRISDCQPKQKRQEIPPVDIDLLKAILAVNRAAKRYRDSSQSHYHNNQHGFAGSDSDKKRHLYYLKDRGIIAAYLEGRLKFEGLHGGLAIYRGEKYFFHSTLIPIAEQVDSGQCQVEYFFKESQPKEASEARLKDAEHTLSSLDVTEEGFDRLEPPNFSKPSNDGVNLRMVDEVDCFDEEEDSGF
ncbi:MAG: hypothetical protein RH917_08265 [Lacipirellulaceae bacterium]